MEGFDASPTVMMTYNPPYYPVLMEKAGCRKAKDLYAYFLRCRDMHDGRMRRIAGSAGTQDGLRIRPINMADFAREVDSVWKIYNCGLEP